MEKFEKTMLKLFLDHPLDYRKFISGYKNPGYALRVIHSFIPTDTGIEFEVGHDLIKRVLSKKVVGGYNHLLYENEDEVTYRIGKGNTVDNAIKELSRLYKFWCKSFFDKHRSRESGIHIHTNLIKGRFTSNDAAKLRESYDHDLAQCISLTANKFFEYSGDYNRNTFSTSKGHSIIARLDFGSIEYRCINMTWDLRELLKYIVFCHKWTNYLYQLKDEKITAQQFKQDISKLVSDIKPI